MNTMSTISLSGTRVERSKTDQDSWYSPMIISDTNLYWPSCMWKRAANAFIHIYLADSVMKSLSVSSDCVELLCDIA